MEDLITHVDNLSKQCAAITISRRANDRHTALRRRLARVNWPLVSVLCKLKRKLVVQSVTSEEFESYVRSVLHRFRSDIQSLVRSLDNEARSEELLALLQTVTGSLACM